jgi:NADPH2 dehydrogenase
MTEIKEYVELYAQAAKNAVEAGFDGVELHGTLRNRSPLNMV